VIEIPTENPLKALREKLLISRSELARRASLSVATLDRIEKGDRGKLYPSYQLERKRSQDPVEHLYPAYGG